MLRLNHRPGFVDMVWVAAHDTRWHTAEEIAGLVQSPIESVLSVLVFLERFGFARSSAGRVVRFRMDPQTPSPKTIARSLRLLLRGFGYN
jgi:hypothetical protein